MSTLAFGRALVAAGHDVVSLVRSFDHPRCDLLHEQLVDLSVRAPGALGRGVVGLDATLGRRAHMVPGHAHPVWSTPYPEHALPRILRLFEPDVVVGNSIDRVSWRRCAALVRRAGSRTALHLREANAIGHLTVSGEVPDVLLANAQSLVELANEAGHTAFLVPSVVELDRCRVESTRRVALFVHPEPHFGLDVVLRLAAARPHVPFVLQESRPLGNAVVPLERRVAALPNVEVRRRRPPEAVFADTRVLLVPHLTEGWSNRPRVVLEAQHNGIPVLATDFPGLREAVGDGGLLVPVDAPMAQWEAAFDQVWNDPAGDLRARARAHAARPEVRPATVVAAFEAAVATTGLDPRPPPRPGTDVSPGLTVVIPAHNAAGTIMEQLDAVLAQEWAPGFEVVVADNLSTDATAELVRRRMEADERVRLVGAPEGRGASYGRNAGVAAARSESIAFCDADDVVSPGWVESMGKALQSHDLVAGRVDVLTLNEPGLARSRGLAMADGPGRFGPVSFAHGCNMGVRRTALEAVGGWDGAVRTGEDIELCLRLWQGGVGLHYEPSAEVRYRIRGTEAAQWRQAVRYGAAHVDLVRRLEVRQLARPSRLRGLRNLAWLVRHCGDTRNPARRPHWLWTAGLSLGHVEGSVRYRTPYL
jgi:glycosyltransferase involved in cell wall biosynthesis